MKNLFYFFLVLLFTSCKSSENNVIIFNANNNYPEIDLKLSDVANVEYIQLKPGKDSILINGFTNKARELFIANDKIFLLDQNRKIVIYDNKGNPLTKIENIGRGPKKFVGLIDFFADSTKSEIYCFSGDGKKMLIYDFNGKYKKHFSKDKITYFQNVNLLENSKFLGYRRVFKDDDKRPILTILSSKFEIESSIPFSHKRPYIFDPDGVLEYSSIINAKKGDFLFSLRSDTIYYLNNNLKIIPRFVDQTPYGSENIQIYPTIETNEYVFFCTLFSHITDPEGKVKYFVYDKKNKGFFRLKQSSSSVKDRNFKSNFQLALIKDFIEINSLTLTLNNNIAAALIPAHLLIENRESLPTILKEMSKDINENDNPVLMLMKFK